MRAVNVPASFIIVFSFVHLYTPEGFSRFTHKMELLRNFSFSTTSAKKCGFTRLSSEKPQDL
jgi:hypothetical protein